MARRRTTRRFPERMIGLATTVVVLRMAWFPPTCLQTVEHQRFDPRLKWFSWRAPSEPMAIVAIEEGSVTTLACWPWMGWRIAALVPLLVAISAEPPLTSDPGSVKG